MPFITLDEKREDIQFLREQIENKKISPGVTVKFKSEAEQVLTKGQDDFMVVREYSTDFRNGEKKGEIFPTEKWGSSDEGFRIHAGSIPDLLDTIAYIMDTYPDKNKFYFVCNSPDIGYPQINGVDTMITEINTKLSELQQPGEYIRESHFDR